MIAIIDADAIIYIVAWHNREEKDPVNWLYSADSVVNTMLLTNKATGYYGVFSKGECFRHDRYKMRPYKGNRPEKEVWFRRQERVIKEHLCKHWGFFHADNLEADDVVCWMAEALRTRETPISYLICSPDKDLKQIPGENYDYAKDIRCTIGHQEADYRFWIQMLMGDETDNVVGIPGMGEKKAEELLKKSDPLQYRSLVTSAYRKYFGSYYGDIIFAETYDTVRLLCSEHPFCNQYRTVLNEYLLLNFRNYECKLTATPSSAAAALTAMFGTD